MMPTRMKRPKATPASIIAAECDIAREHGWGAVTIRSIADRLGYKSPLIYEHFGSKGEAIAAAAQEGFHRLQTSMGSVDGDPGTEGRVVALAQAYLHFALREPELYRVMHGMDGSTTDPKTIAAGAEAVCELACSELAQWAEAANVALPSPLAATETLWCLLHGIATLSLAQRLHSDDARAELAPVRTLLAGWHAGVY